MHDHRGYTLIETMTVVAILAVLLALGLPSFADTLARHQVSIAMHLISTDLAMARNSAIMRRSAVVVCPKTDTLQCRTDADWRHGWIVFRDPDGNRRPDSDADLLRVSDAPPGVARGLRLDATRALVRYQRDGRSAGTNLSVRICHRDILGGSIIVNNVGRVRTARPATPTACPI